MGSDKKQLNRGFQSLKYDRNIVALGDVPIRIQDKLQIGDGYCLSRRRVLPSSEASPRATVAGYSERTGYSGSTATL